MRMSKFHTMGILMLCAQRCAWQEVDGHAKSIATTRLKNVVASVPRVAVPRGYCEKDGVRKVTYSSEVPIWAERIASNRRKSLCVR